MDHRATRAIVGAALLAGGMALPAAGAQSRYAPGQQQKLLATMTVQSGRQELQDLRARRDLSGLATFAERLVARSAVAPLESEHLLTEWLIAVREVPPDAELRAAVSGLTAYPSKALGPNPEPHRAHETWIPVFDVASQARGTLRAWELAGHVAGAGAALAAGNLQALPLGDPEALAQALASAPLSQLTALRDSRLALPTQAAATLARRLADPDLYAALFAGPVDEFVMRALRDAPAVLASQDARRVLLQAANRPALASAATLATAPLELPTSDLLACLGEPGRGGSCAQLLAQRGDPATIEALASVLSARDDLATRRALLALWWSNSARAREVLSAYHADHSMPAALRAQVSQWLR